jgi:hypothetical protein
MKFSRYLFAIIVVIACVLNLSASAAPLTPGNLLVSTEGFGVPADVVLEYTAAGTQVQSFSVPYPSGRPVTEDVRDIYVDGAGNVQIYNGTFSPFLTSLNPATSAFVHNTTAGMSSVANVSFGGLTTLGNFGYLSDMATASPGGPNGIVRFDLTTFTSTRFGAGNDYGDVTVGGDGLLYAIRNPGGGVNATSVDVYDPSTLALSRTITLAAALATADVRGLAVDAAGVLYAAAWDGNVYQVSSSGSVLNQRTTGASNLQDIDLDDSGRLLVGGRFGNVILTTTALTSQTSFVAGGGNAIHVAFTTPLTIVPEPGALVLAAAAGLLCLRRGKTV